MLGPLPVSIRLQAISFGFFLVVCACSVINRGKKENLDWFCQPKLCFDLNQERQRQICWLWNTLPRQKHMKFIFPSFEFHLKILKIRRKETQPSYPEYMSQPNNTHVNGLHWQHDIIKTHLKIVSCNTAQAIVSVTLCLCSPIVGRWVHHFIF